MTGVYKTRELRTALKRNEFVLYFQPIVDLVSHDVVGFESLVRWRSPIHGEVLPMKFIPAIENSSLMNELGLWIIEQSFKGLEVLREITGRPVFISLNVSPKQLEDPQFTEKMEVLRKHTSILPGDVKLELTELLLMQTEGVGQTLHQIRALGYALSIDDFGTGYSSFAYLNEFDLDNLKLDQHFTQHLANNIKGQKIVQAILNLARSLQMECVVEGVETPEVAQILKDMGFSYAQGFLFGRPQPIEYYLEDAA